MNWRLPRLAISLDNQTGILSLVGFPTIQLAEEYFESLFGLMDHDSKPNSISRNRVRCSQFSRETSLPEPPTGS